MKRRTINRKYAGKDNPNYKGLPTSFLCANCGKEGNVKCNSLLVNSKNHFCCLDCQKKWKSNNLLGSNAYNWRGGINPLQNSIRLLTQTKEWNKEIIRRDCYKCQNCGINNNKLDVHHLIGVTQIIRLYNITTTEEAKDISLFWDLNNGATLCKKCHKLFHTLFGIYNFTVEDFINFKGDKSYE